MSVSSSATPVILRETSTHANAAARSAWSGPVIALIVAWTLTLIVLRQTVASVITIWTGSSTYSYGFLIVPICALLVWRRKADLRNLSPTISVSGLLLFFVSAGLWVAGNVADVQLIQHVALVGMLDSLAWAFLGSRVLRVLRFPLLFLFFAVPAGDGLVPILQQWTASFTVIALRASGIPVFQDGLALYTPSGNWQVAEACSGIRYLIASIVMGILVAGIAYRSWKRRIAFLVLSALLPIVANAVRAYGIIVLAYLSGNAIATGADHIIYGFVFFSTITGVLLIVAIRGYEPTNACVALRETPVAATSGSGVGIVAILVAVFLAVTSAKALTDFLWSLHPAPPTGTFYAIPAGWVPSTELDNEWAPEPMTIRSRKVESFSSGSDVVSTAFGWYQEGRRGIELINSTNAVGKSGAWIVLSTEDRRISLRGEPILVSEHTIAHGSQRRLVWSWYSAGGRVTSNPYELRLIQAWNRILGRPKNVALTAVSAQYQADPSEASRILEEFLK